MIFNDFAYYKGQFFFNILNYYNKLIDRGPNSIIFIDYFHIKNTILNIITEIKNFTINKISPILKFIVFFLLQKKIFRN